MTIFTRAEHVLQELALIQLVHDRMINSGAIGTARGLGGIASIPNPQPIRLSSYDTAPPHGRPGRQKLPAQIKRSSEPK